MEEQQQEQMQEEQKMEQSSMEETPTMDAMDDQKDIEENKFIAALSYLGILCLVPLLAKKESKFAQFHAKQGLMYLIVMVLASFVVWFPIIGWLLWLVLVVLDIIGFVQALSGKYWEMPVIGGLAKKYLKNL